MPALPTHPAAEIFPLLTGAELDALAADIKEHGQREPIIIHDGMILDGRNRYAACEQIGREPITEEWDRDGTPEAFVISMNLHRRHLNESQRAMIAATLATALSGQRTDLVQIGTRPMTTQETAGMLNVGRHAVFDAKAVKAEGTPEEIEAVESGEAAVTTTAKQVRKRRPKKREQPLSQTGKNPERIQNRKINAEIWKQVRDALTHLTSLPLPSDVISIVRAHDKTGHVDARIDPSLAWLKEFENAWRDRDQVKA